MFQSLSVNVRWLRQHPFMFGAVLLALVCFGRFFSTSPATAGQPEQVDEYIQAEMTKRKIPGLALAVIKNGEVVKMQGYGLANLDHDVPVTPDTVFELASLTKQFTATAIMLLAEEGKLKVDDPVSQYLANAPAQWQGVTLRHLLTHTAGLAAMEQGFGELRGACGGLDHTTAQMFAAAAKDPMAAAPGEQYSYSDVGFFLLGMVIEKASGQSYRDFLAGRFFKPLGMTATSVLDQWAILKHRAAGYTLRQGQLINIRRIAQEELPSHYGIFSSVRDMAKWEIALAAGKVVKEASLKAMWTPAKLNNGQAIEYGFGWGLVTRGGYRLIDHTGITGTEYARFPDHQLTVIVLTNLGVVKPERGKFRSVDPWGGPENGIAWRYVPALRR